MASGPFSKDVLNSAPGIVEIDLAFDTDTTNDPTLHSSDNHAIASVKHTGTGQYTVTLREKFAELKSAIFTAQFGTPIDLVPQILSNDVTGAKTIVLSLLAAAVATDPPAKGTNAGTIFGILKLRNTVAK